MKLLTPVWCQRCYIQLFLEPKSQHRVTFTVVSICRRIFIYLFAFSFVSIFLPFLFTFTLFPSTFFCILILLSPSFCCLYAVFYDTLNTINFRYMHIAKQTRNFHKILSYSNLSTYTSTFSRTARICNIYST